METIRVNPEFGVELALAVPYAYWLHTQGQLQTVITSKGMKPFYFFCSDVREEFNARTIDNAEAGMFSLPNPWIHHNAKALTGVDYSELSEDRKKEVNGVLDYNKWVCPSYRDHFKNSEFVFDKPVVFVTNKYNMEHGEPPLGFFNIQCLYELFTYLNEHGYTVIYKRAKNTEPEFAIDQNETNSLSSGFHDITAEVEDIGKINDFQLTKFFPDVLLYDEIVAKSSHSYNETQLMIMANCSYFISVCGGNSILSSLFGGTVISYIHKGKELRPNYFGPNSYFRKLSGANIIPTYDLQVTKTGVNDYTDFMAKVKENFR
jgi:hypothetical protein